MIPVSEIFILSQIKKLENILADLKQNHSVCGLKAEFETEGASYDEVLLLKKLCDACDLNLTVKIGGCGAIRDLSDIAGIGASAIVSPMIESSYAVKKFLESVKQVFTDINVPDLYINLETKQGFSNFEEMLALEDFNLLKGIVVGRDDLTGSMGLSREYVNSSIVLDMINTVQSLARSNNLEMIIGGSIGTESIQFFEKLQSGMPDKFETRKVIFATNNNLNFELGILKAIEFEILWLENRQNLSDWQVLQDFERIKMLQSKYSKMSEAISGC